ncbi:MAG: histidine triad protein [Bacteroidota bacterium]|jgi:histidine triad (HIT) family protein|nr:histidine triad protein [Bacteroidota bacterium]
MPSIFSRIVNGEIPCYKIAENDHYFAFLDAFPLKKGHVLVIPKVEVDYIFDLDDNVYCGLMEFAKVVAIAMKKAISCERIAISVMGLEVPHAHVHLIPMNTTSDVNFSNSKLKLEPEEFLTNAAQIRAHIPQV